MKKQHLLSPIVLLALSLPSLAATTQWQIENQGQSSETAQTIEIPLKALGIKDQEKSYPIVTNAQGDELPSQVCYDGNLIFQLNLKATQIECITISTSDKAPQYEAKVHGRFVPERKDDWAWENDKISYRLYGPAALAADWLSNGLDVWLKRTPELIIEKWYEVEDYHVDHGEGLDCYDVSRTLGMGTLSPMRDDELDLGSNFISGKTIDQGPLRYTVQINYPEQTLQGGKVQEKRVISLDAGAQLNKITVTYQSAADFEFDGAIGFIKRAPEGSRLTSPHCFAYAEACPENNGIIYAGAITTEEGKHTILSDHECVLVKLQSNVPFTYYAGAGWSKFGFTSLNQWAGYLQQLQAPQNKYKVTQLPKE